MISSLLLLILQDGRAFMSGGWMKWSIAFLICVHIPKITDQIRKEQEENESN